MNSTNIYGDIMRRVAADTERQMNEITADSGTLPPSVGERNAAARMTEDKVRALRDAYDSGARLAGLANAFGISHRAARHIAQRTSWTHVQ